jgi:hypothetical protein
MNITTLMAERSLLADSPIGRIRTIYNQRELLSVGALCYYSLTQHRNGITLQT